jgi:hypothetical protein
MQQLRPPGKRSRTAREQITARSVSFRLAYREPVTPGNFTMGSPVFSD